jgi:hypothetical protein
LVVEDVEDDEDEDELDEEDSTTISSSVELDVEDGGGVTDDEEGDQDGEEEETSTDEEDDGGEEDELSGGGGMTGPGIPRGGATKGMMTSRFAAGGRISRSAPSRSASFLPMVTDNRPTNSSEFRSSVSGYTG